MPPQWRREVAREERRAENVETEVKGRVSENDSGSGMLESVENPKSTVTRNKEEEDGNEDEIEILNLIGNDRMTDERPSNEVARQESELEEIESEGEGQCDQLIDCSQQPLEGACSDTLVADLFGEVEPAKSKVTPTIAIDQTAIDIERNAQLSDNQEVDDLTNSIQVEQVSEPAQTVSRLTEEAQRVTASQAIMRPPARRSACRRMPPGWLSQYRARPVKRSSHLSASSDTEWIVVAEC